ncbi:MAG: hypothetical protein CSA10_01195 [Cardiobacteriales bacterium]|nr:MAG: hypothetical protein CSA10_01195 [Cardiobacteriales bacterium]
MATPSSLFYVHHQNAKRSSQKLSFIFWLGVLLSSVSYILIALLLIYISTFGKYWAWETAIMLSSIPIITTISAYFDRRRHMFKTSATELAKELGAKPLSLTGNLAQQQLRNIVEEMAVSSGIQPPPILIMSRDDSINAFVLGGANHTIALTVSQGALNNLTRDELQALVAHEFGHIINEDVWIYSKLSAMLHGYFIISEWRYGSRHAISSSRIQFWGRDDSESSHIDLFYLILGFWGTILLGVGRLIQAAFSREREWMADARSVEYTRNSTALISLLKKALALQYLKANTPVARESIAHFFFINYQPLNHFTQRQTHPPIKERIQRYGGSINDEEIAAIAYELQEKRRESPLDNIIDKHRYAFSTTTLYPILTVNKHLNQARQPTKFTDETSLAATIYAFFLFHCGQNLFEISQNPDINQIRFKQAKPYFSMVGNCHPIEQIFYYQQYCRQVTYLSSAEQQSLRKDIDSLIQVDKDFTIYEWCYLLILHHYMTPVVNQEQHYQNLAEPLQRLFSFCASIYSDGDDNMRQQLFSYLCQHGLPIRNANYHELLPSANTFASMEQDIEKLKTLKPMYRQQLLSALKDSFASLKQQNLVGIYIHHTMMITLGEK